MSDIEFRVPTRHACFWRQVRRDGAPFQVRHRARRVRGPFIRKVNFLTLARTESEVSETCVTKQGIALNVRAVIAFKVRQRRGEHRQRRAAVPVRPGPDVHADRSDIRGHLRSIIGSMTVEEIVTERQKLAT